MMGSFLFAFGPCSSSIDMQEVFEVPMWCISLKQLAWQIMPPHNCAEKHCPSSFSTRRSFNKHNNISNTSWNEVDKVLFFTEHNRKLVVNINIDFLLFQYILNDQTECFYQSCFSYMEISMIIRKTFVFWAALLSLTVIIAFWLCADLEALSKEEEFCSLHLLQSNGPAWHAVSFVWEWM